MTGQIRKLYLIRHAKSSWADLSLSDHDRPLNERGKRDLPRMADYVEQQYGIPNLFLCSTAKRAQQTARGFIKSSKASVDIILEETLYLCSPNSALQIVRNLGYGPSIALVGHNPGWTECMNKINGVQIDNMPTCGVCILHFNSTNWSTVEWSDLSFVDFTYPKKLM